MNNTSLNCSLNDTTNLKNLILENLILENPDLPLLIFYGEESWHDEYPYEQAEVGSVGISELTLYNDRWMDKVFSAFSYSVIVISRACIISAASCS